MKTNVLVIGIAIFIIGTFLSALGMIAGQELNDQGDTDIFPEEWNSFYNPVISYAFAWIMIIFIPISIAGISVIAYGILSRLAKQIAVGIGVSLLGVYVGIIVMGYPYT